MSAEERNYLWRHFAANVDQRLKAFSFFVVLSVFANGGVLAIFDKGMHPVALLLAGGFIAVLAAVFFVVDRRSRYLLHLAYPGLKALETGFPKHSRIFTIEGEERNRMLSYTTAFNTLFALQFIFGTCIAIYSLFSLVYGVH